MKRFILAVGALLVLAPNCAWAQSAPSWISYGYTPTAGQWRGAFASKQDLLPYTPLSLTGGTMTGKLYASASTANGSGFAILPGVAPTSPANGDVWVTSSGFFVRANGQTASVLPVGTTAGTVAAGNDSRIVGALQASTAATTYAPLASPALTGTPTAPTATAGTNSTQLATTAFVANAIAGGASILPLGQVRLTYSSATALLVKPYNGNQIVVNGAYQTVPSAGVPCSNAGTTQATLYYEYLYMAGSTLTCELSTTGHATGTNGVEIKSGDPTRTLVGMSYMAAGTPGTFADGPGTRYVASWFNRIPRDLFIAGTSGSTTSTTAVEISTANRASFVSWGDAAAQGNLYGYTTSSGSSADNFTALTLDGTQVGTTMNTFVPTNGRNMSLAIPMQITPSEGFHYFGYKGYVGANQGTWQVSVGGGVTQ